MAARHITKCPECERVTGDMVNSALAIDRTEYDGKHCQRCIDKNNAAKAATQTRIDNAVTVDMTKITEALSHASRNLRRPKLWLGDLVVYPAAAHSQNAGCLYVKQGRGETGIYLGKIAGTKFIRSRECTDAQETFLLESAKDPHAAAVLHGKLTGCCACCGRELTNPESVARGIGPVCAENFGW